MSKPDEISVKKSAKERSNGYGRFILGCSLVSKETPKLFLCLYLIHKRRNVKFKFYLELSYFCATQPTLTGHHSRHRPYIHIIYGVRVIVEQTGLKNNYENLIPLLQGFKKNVIYFKKLALYFIHKSHNVKLKLYLELS